MILKMLIALACFVTAITSASVIPKDTAIKLAHNLQHQDLQKADILESKILNDKQDTKPIYDQQINTYKSTEINGPLEDAEGNIPHYECIEAKIPSEVAKAFHVDEEDIQHFDCTEVKGALEDPNGPLDDANGPVEDAEGKEEQKHGTEALFNHLRFRREANPQYFNGDRGRVDARVGHGNGGGVDVNVNGQIRPWESRNGRTTLDVHGHASQTFGGPNHMRRPDYGVGVTFIHRFRR